MGKSGGKLALTHTPDPIRPTRRVPDPNRRMYDSKEAAYELEGLVRGGLVNHYRRGTTKQV